jgi:chemotaxis methyl-accepting protein methylase
LLGRYFERLPANGGWRFNAHQAASINWVPIGSAHSETSVGPVDIAVCHRTAAELGSTARRELFGRLAKQIACDGFLVITSNESDWPKAGFEPLCTREVAVYRRTRRETSVLSA